MSEVGQAVPTAMPGHPADFSRVFFVVVFFVGRVSLHWRI